MTDRPERLDEMSLRPEMFDLLGAVVADAWKDADPDLQGHREGP